MTVGGLTAGDYSYSVTGMNTVNWSDWNTSTPNWTGMVNIPGSSAGVPEPASLALVAIGMLGLGFSRRKTRKA